MNSLDWAQVGLSLVVMLTGLYIALFRRSGHGVLVDVLGLWLRLRFLGRSWQSGVRWERGMRRSSRVGSSRTLPLALGGLYRGADALSVTSTTYRLEPCPTEGAPSGGRLQLMAKRNPATATTTPTASETNSHNMPRSTPSPLVLPNGTPLSARFKAVDP